MPQTPSPALPPQSQCQGRKTKHHLSESGAAEKNTQRTDISSWKNVQQKHVKKNQKNIRIKPMMFLLADHLEGCLIEGKFSLQQQKVFTILHNSRPEIELLVPFCQRNVNSHQVHLHAQLGLPSNPCHCLPNTCAENFSCTPRSFANLNSVSPSAALQDSQN